MTLTEVRSVVFFYKAGEAYSEGLFQLTSENARAIGQPGRVSTMAADLTGTAINRDIASLTTTLHSIKTLGTKVMSQSIGGWGSGLGGRKRINGYAMPQILCSYLWNINIRKKWKCTMEGRRTLPGVPWRLRRPQRSRRPWRLRRHLRPRRPRRPGSGVPGVPGVPGPSPRNLDYRLIGTRY